MKQNRLTLLIVAAPTWDHHEDFVLLYRMKPKGNPPLPGQFGQFDASALALTTRTITGTARLQITPTK